MWRLSHYLFYAFVKENCYSIPTTGVESLFYSVFWGINCYVFLVSSKCFYNSISNRCLVLVAMVKEENDADLIIIQQRTNWSTTQTILESRLARLERLLGFYLICRRHGIVTLSVYILQSYFFNSLVENKAP